MCMVGERPNRYATDAPDVIYLLPLLTVTSSDYDEMAILDHLSVIRVNLDFFCYFLFKANSSFLIFFQNLMSLAPRKPDWDLKRGVEKKLRKLEKRTQRAIAEMIRKLFNKKNECF
ncbi:unnamed protein product [Trichobilharzia regenti]|nr:unnamed protein product [Trichobilharzia regenti]